MAELTVNSEIGLQSAIGELREAYDYSPESGLFVRRKGKGSKRGAGSVAGTVNAVGYVMVRAFGKWHTAHRLAWLYVHGRWPVGQIDHIYRVRTDNRISNLREVRPEQNSWNMSAHRDNPSGVRGVSWDKARGMWRADICKRGKRKAIGRFKTIEEASSAYEAAKAELHGGGE